MEWKAGNIDGCMISPLKKFGDERGWLGEFFRQDELDERLHPVMGYISETKPATTRGPHEHEEQTDLFLFFSGTFRIYLWDGREDSPTHGIRQRLEAGADNPVTLIIPPGVVHAYRNIGETPALVVNCPNRLYAGEGKQEPVDEIRHEGRENSRYLLD